MVLSVAILLGMRETRADQVHMLNGDQYSGKVTALDSNSVVLQSELLGTLHLPRAKVARVAVDSAPAAPAKTEQNQFLPTAKAALTNADPEWNAMLRQLHSHTNLAQQVQSRLLGGENSEASAKFNELLGGLMNGQLNLDDLRAQARSAAEQLRAARKDLGDDAGWAMDSYLTILDHFLKEAGPATSSAQRGTNHSAKPNLNTAEQE